jgi:hypothetical protein
MWEERPKNYFYCLKIIQLCILLKLRSSVSFRAIEQIMIIINMHFQISTKAPTHSTILLWVKKYGYYELNKPKLKAEDWVVMLDESVQFGQNKLLVVYGLRECNIDFTRPLNYRDLTPLLLKSKSSWSGESIKETLEDVQENIGGNISYAVADQGNTIKKALRLMKIPHIYDLTHRIALSLEHIYRKDAEFKAYTEHLTYLRRSEVLGKMSHVLPPLQRAKSRFMNLRPISDWGLAALNLVDSSADFFQDEKQYLSWVKDYRSLIMELVLLNEIINKIQFILKTEGLSRQTAGKTKKILNKCKTKRLKDFKCVINEYIDQTMNVLPDVKRILCNTDILESSFGKYKNYLQNNPMVGITNLCLSISAFTGSMDNSELKDAFENTKVRNIEQWTETNIGKTTLSKRQEVLKMGCRIFSNY